MSLPVATMGLYCEKQMGAIPTNGLFCPVTPLIECPTLSTSIEVDPESKHDAEIEEC